MIIKIIVVALSGLTGLFFYLLYKKNIWVWIGSYLSQKMTGQPRINNGETIHMIFCCVDHFEPIYEGSTKDIEEKRMKVWSEGYPRMATKHSDSNGRPPQHTWFYPGEAYNSQYLDDLVDLCRDGFGEIEFHHHHHYETSDGLRKSILEALGEFAEHGACVNNGSSPEYTYGFIHGNMAFDNSMLDDEWCGVNDEITILRETGCYADFSSPTAPCKSQTKKINSIYYATDDPEKPKSHNEGVDVEVGRRPSGDLLIIQGPLALNWKKRKYGIFPTIDNGEVHGNAPGTPDRVERWTRQHIHVKGRPNWVFVKISCHGAEEESHDVLLRDEAHSMYAYLEERYRDREGYALHYVTAREFYNIIKAAEAGENSSPLHYYNYSIQPYKYKSII